MFHPLEDELTDVQALILCAAFDAPWGIDVDHPVLRVARTEIEPLLAHGLVEVHEHQARLWIGRRFEAHRRVREVLAEGSCNLGWLIRETRLDPQDVCAVLEEMVLDGLVVCTPRSSLLALYGLASLVEE